MDSVLIVSSAEATTISLRGLMRQGGAKTVDVYTSGGEARRRIAEKEYGLVLVNAPLSDEFGDAMALTAAEKTGAFVILFAKAETADATAAKVEGGGVMVLPKPISKTLLFQAAKMADAAGERIRALQKENAKLTARLEEARVVGRAKCALIQYRSLTEDEAHKLIEREAMDTRSTRREVAAGILQTFEG